nr:RecName: Full=CAPA-Pyrokinin; Short=CAPA-PK; AltName: Full=FXPRL-amide [Karoophasma botterkloofense]B3A060.1 RecName: Full=CAPA-Pyrokinin; Short=CAPA-PK; AltName: Full=FXPRL-amide [Karoophasma biedouwense]B3A0B8.1 RecName: Full=CAPA-Pyrokinin; Short=CAPA-PK; AltName: Full=FXPRL-amide [Hemilobophasma montaguense]
SGGGDGSGMWFGPRL